MGDILHALPAVARPQARPSRLAAHLGGGTEMGAAARTGILSSIGIVAAATAAPSAGCSASYRALRRVRYRFAVDFQGLLKSGSGGRRGPAGSAFTASIHGAGARTRRRAVLSARISSIRGATWWTAISNWPRPPARVHRRRRAFSRCRRASPKASCPAGEFVLASPLAGWRSKQWPVEHYRALAARLRRELGIPLVLNGPPGAHFGDGSPGAGALSPACPA